MSGLFGLGPKAKQAAPAVGALNIQQSSYGTPITLVYGTNRTTGNMLWYDDFYYVTVNSGGGGGGKGGGGGGGKGGSGSGTYNYYASFAIGVCEGPIQGIGQVWENKTITTIPNLGGTVFTGTLGQSPWGYLSTNHPTKALGYNNLAYVGFPTYFLGTSAETPNLGYEVQGLKIIGGGNQDAYADQVVSDFLARAAWPTAYLGSLTTFANFCTASGWFISPVVDQQQQASQWLNYWVQSLYSEFVWSNGALSIVPYGDSVLANNGATYTPNLTPVYNLSDSDFIVSGDEDPITCSRKDLADAYNQMPIEYVNRADQYNLETYTAEDAGHIDMFGIRTASTMQAHHVTDASMAQNMASLALWRQLYVRTTYAFKLGWRHVLLDPMDLVTITDMTLGLNNTLVRITDIEEDENGLLSITAEEMPGDIASPAIYASQAPARYLPNYDATAAGVNAPVIFEAPLALVQASDVEIWLGVSAPSNQWGGCRVYISSDDTTFTFLTEIIGQARQGVLTANLASNTAAPDTTDTLAIDLTESLASINGTPTSADALAFNTLSYVDGELISFGGSSLTAQYKYNLTYLMRGAYGSPVNSHAIGSKFLRLDQSIYKYAIDQKRIGETIYFKFQSFNLYGGGLEDLSTLSTYPYTITGTALLTPLTNPGNLSVNYLSDIGQINWSGVIDIRSPILYEIRKGSSWSGGQTIGRTQNLNFPVYGSGTYWVSALFITPLGVYVYSSSPPSIAVTVPQITRNTINTFSETGVWSGTLTNCTVVSGNVELNSGSSSGTYQIPSGHRIASNYIVTAKVLMNWTVAPYNISGSNDIPSIADITAIADITDGTDQVYIFAQPQINLSQDGGTTWSGWQNWIPGFYTFNKIDFQVVLTTTNQQVLPILSALSGEVDADQRIDTGTATTLNTGIVNISFVSQFNVTPLIHITIVSASAGDQVILSGENSSQFSVEVLNSGSPVVRTINWTATGW